MVDILIFGKDGQVGTELQRSLATLGTVRAVGRHEADLSNSETIHQALHSFQPKIIVNAAAYTAVDQAESERELAQLINVEAVRLMADYAQKNQALLVHYSTDYVFDGLKNTAYSETDATNPQGVYGLTKLQGEQAIMESGCAHYIFRTSWVFAAHSNNFLRTMMRLAMQRDQLTVVSDQIGAPTSAALIADITALSLYAYQQQRLPLGLYHLAAAGHTSWHGFAQYIVEHMLELHMQPRVSPSQVLAIPTSQYPTPAKRPAFSLLNSHKLETQLAIVMPDWQLHARQAIAQLAHFAKL